MSSDGTSEPVEIILSRVESAHEIRRRHEREAREKALAVEIAFIRHLVELNNSVGPPVGPRTDIERRRGERERDARARERDERGRER